jgi:Na+/proline symporter
MLLIATVIYLVTCIAIGIWSSTKKVVKASDFFLAGHSFGPLILSLTMMATVFSAWFILGHQGTMWTLGFPYIAHFMHVPLLALSGAIFFPRLWAICRRNGYITPSELYGEYFGGDFIRILVVVVAVLYAIPYVALQLRGAGFVFNTLSGGEIPVVTGSIVLGIAVILYVFLGGLRATAITDTIQGILLLAAAVILAVVTLSVVGQITGKPFLEAFKEGIVAAGTPYYTLPALGQMYSWPYILSVSIVIAGINFAPPYTMIVASAKSPRIFRFQSFVVMSVIMGFMYYIFSPMVGVGGRNIISKLANPDSLTLEIVFNYMGPVSFLITSLGILAAMNSTAAGYLANTSTIFARDIYCRYINPNASPKKQVYIGRFMVLFIVVLAALFSVVFLDLLTILGSLATSFGIQMMPAMLAVTYCPKITREGVEWGIITGCVAVIFTYFIVRYPLGIHMGGWGLAINFIVCFIISSMTQKPAAKSLERTHGIWDRENFGALEAKAK